MRGMIVAACAALASAAAAVPASAADIRVVASGAPAEVAKQVGEAFAASTGHRVLFTVGTVAVIVERLAGGEPADVVVLPTPAVETLDQKGLLRTGSRINLARVGIGVAVRQGAALPDISSRDALRKVLLDARAIVYSDPQGGGFAGARVARMMQELGIADAVKPKTTLRFAIGGGVDMVAKGDADVGLFNISEIVPVKGVTLVGPLPAEFQSYINFSGALHAKGASPEAARAYLQSLTELKASAAWTAGGFEPLGAGR